MLAVNFRQRLSQTFGVWSFLFGIFLFASCRDSRVHDKAEWGRVYESRGVKNACMIVRDNNHEAVYFYNKDGCLAQVSPASTFKIFNSLVALDNALVQDDRTIIPWDGVTRGVAAWNSPLSLREAFRASAVPHFQELARRAGVPLMKKMLDSARYGNAAISRIDTFWLDGSLRISADEQVGLLKRMYFYELPFSERSQRIVKSMMLFEDSSAQGFRLYYKTGWGTEGDSCRLWVAGFMERIERVKEDERSMNKSDQRVYPYFFAQHFTIPAADTGKRDWMTERIRMAKEALREFRKE